MIRAGVLGRGRPRRARAALRIDDDQVAPRPRRGLAVGAQHPEPAPLRQRFVVRGVEHREREAGAQARERGLVDRVGSFGDALASARAKGKLAADWQPKSEEHKRARRIVQEQERLIAEAQASGEKVTPVQIDRAIEKIRTDSERDYFMSANEAKDYGLIDQVLEKRA